MKRTTLYIILYFAVFFIHFGISQYLKINFQETLIRYYLFLTIVFMMVVTVISIIKKVYPQYIGFAFMGLVMLKLTLMILIMKKLNLTAIPEQKFHFIIPYLISLVLETLYAVEVIKQGDASQSVDKDHSAE